MDFRLSSGSEINKRPRSNSLENEHNRVSDERRETENRTHRVWGGLMEWFDTTSRDEAQASLLGVYSNVKTEFEKLECYFRLEELAGADQKMNFVSSRSMLGRMEFRIHTGDENPPSLVMSTAATHALKTLFKLTSEDMTPVAALRQALTHTKAVAELVETARRERSGTLDILGCRFMLFLPALPGSLKSLNIPEAQILTSLPDLPESVEQLSLGDNRLIEVLPPFPRHLTDLMLTSYRALSILPGLPATVETVYLRDCPNLIHISSLVSAEALTSLTIWGCDRLSYLPSLPDSLEELDLTGSTALPDDIPLPEGLGFYANAAGLDDRPDDDLEGVAERYCADAGKSREYIEKFRASWATVEAMPLYQSFEVLLDRLADDDLLDLVSPLDVVEVMEEVITSPLARELIFEQAQTADQDCQDRPLVIFNTVQSLARFSKLQREGAPGEDVFALAEGMLKMALLDEATSHVMLMQWREGRRTGNDDNDGPNLSEALEVQLELRRVLGLELKLPFQAQSLYSEELAYINDDDRSFAFAYVEERMNNVEQKTQGLLAVPMWRFHMENICSAEIKLVCDKYERLQDELETENEGGRLTEQDYIERYNELARSRQTEIDQVIIEGTMARMPKP